MPQEIDNFLTRIIALIETAAKTIEAIVTSLFEGLLKLLERTYHLVVDLALRIRDGLLRLTKAIGKLLFASIKLSVLYSPSLLFFRGGYWEVFGILWFLLVIVLSLSNKGAGVNGAVQCPKCQQPLRVRILKDNMTIRCPTCSHEFKIRKRSDKHIFTDPADVLL